MRHARACAAAAATLSLAAGLADSAAASTPPTTQPGPSSEPAAVAPAGEDDVRAAKAGLAWFLLDHVDRPTRVDDPCPTLPVESVGWYLAQAGMAASQRPYGAAVVWETDVGAGLVALRCGMDLSQSPDPEGSVSWSLDVAMLDGQATYAQYAVFLGGRDVTITQLPDRRAQLASTCTNRATRCAAAYGVDGLLLTLRLRGLPGDDTGETVTRNLVQQIAREVVANLGAVPPPP